MVTPVKRLRESTGPPPSTNLRPMSAAPHFFEEPSLASPATVLTVIRGGDVEQRLTDAETLTHDNDHVAALEQLDLLWPDVRNDPALALRHRLAAAWAEMYRGHLDVASDLLAHADSIVQSPHFDASDRATILYRTGCVALKRTEVAEAISLFTRALETNARSARPSLLLAADVRNWRSRCYQLRRDWDAAARDAEASLDLATDAGCERSRAHAMFQASLVAERQRQWLLARFHAEQALGIYREHGDMLSAARILNNLGGIDFLLGDIAGAERSFEDAAATAAAAGSDADVAQATSSLAQLLLRTDRPREARDGAHAALALLAGRVDFLAEIGNAQLVVAKSHAAELDAVSASEWLDHAERTFAELDSTSHLAAVWIARGDVARETGDSDGAAELYRHAAEALQDFHF
jgi:tetratricopeptide (TPR) repeat protein